MHASVTFLAIIIQLANIIDTFGPCTPNTHLVINGFVCVCSDVGVWNEVDCKIIGRRSSCRPGEVVRRGCSECVCQKNFIFRCNNQRCSARVSQLPILQKLSQYGPRCTPFRSYYTNCTLCVCPASGQTSDALCAVDISCPLLKNPVDGLKFEKQNYCFPNVMYLFPCLQCLCSETGTFSFDKCVEKCRTPSTKIIRRCIPGKLYRTGCKICKCPENSLPDNKLCEYAECNNETLSPYKQTLCETKTSCTPHVFSKPKCLFCDCNPDGITNEDSCFELNCSKALKFQYEYSKETCSPGELVSICVECFCLRNGSENSKYCTRSCSNENKIEVLEQILNKNSANTSLINENEINKVNGNNKCIPRSLYIEEGRYCLCPENAITEFKFCTNFYKYFETSTPNATHLIGKVQIDFNVECKPSTLVEFECNICFCSKHGKIDPKWCTYDDCESKKTIQESHRGRPALNSPENSNYTSTCKPGTITTVKCNFCICPDSGILKDRVCTKNECVNSEYEMNYDKFTCEPLAYYEVDCNICYCPSDGLKNLAMCTKNPCDTIFLRSLDSCVPGHLFIDDCNVCVCPVNGNKEDKACTNHNCGVKTYNFFRTPPTMLGNEVTVKRSVDVCFRGEEYVEGCKICVCPEVELKAYAHCEAVLCDESAAITNITTKQVQQIARNKLEKRDVRRSDKGFDDDSCLRITLNAEPERQECTAGSMYIIRCRQCICPYKGNINNFCRPLPKSVHCDQAYPGYNYLPMGRRDTLNTTLATNYKQQNMYQRHKHTRHECEDLGRIMDKCFICECEGQWLIEEHCFQSDAQECLNATPSFIVNNTLVKL